METLTDNQKAININERLSIAIVLKDKKAILECYDVAAEMDFGAVDDDVFLEYDELVNQANTILGY